MWQCVEIAMKIIILCFQFDELFCMSNFSVVLSLVIDWLSVYQDADTDGSGTLDIDEFKGVVKKSLGVKGRVSLILFVVMLLLLSHGILLYAE